MKRAKMSIKVAIASALVMSSTAAVIYAAPNMKKSAEKISTENSIYLDVEKVESNKVKISLDNVEDIAKSVQFSVKLDDNIKIKANEDGNELITNLLSDSDNKIFTDYTYNEEDNTLDVIITSKDYLPKSENKLEVCTLEIESVNKSDRTFNITPNEDEEFKYVSRDNTEYSNLAVNFNENPITLNTKPNLTVSEETINIEDGEELVFDEIEGINTEDIDNDDVVLEVRNITKVTDESQEDSENTIESFSTDEVGTYRFKIYAVDTMGEKSEPKYIYVNVQYNMDLPEPTFEGLNNIEVQSGSAFKPLDGVTAKDAKGRELEVNVSGDLNLNPDVDTTYRLTYTATDIYGKTVTETRDVTVIANIAPEITGVDNKVINIGDNFEPMDGVKVNDDKDKDLIKSVNVSGTVNTAVAGEYKLSYSVTDSGNKTTRVQRIIRVNRPPVVSGHDISVVLKEGTNLTEKVVLNGVNISDETGYDVTVKLPNVNGAGVYKAEITVTDEDKGVTTVSRNIVISSGSLAELPNSGQGTSEEDARLVQVIDKDGITTLNEKLSAATKDYKINLEKKNFSAYVQYSIEISKKEAVFRNSEKTYLKVRVPNNIEEATGGINIKEYVEVLAESVTIDNKESLGHYLSVGDEIELTATIKPDNTHNKELDWISSNEEVLEVVKTEAGVKVIAKSKGIATIKAGATDGSEKYDEISFNVSSNVKDLPEGVTIVGGDGTEESPVIYKTENLDSLKLLLNNIKDDYKVVLQDKKIINDNEVDYYLKLEEKGIITRLLRTIKAAEDNADYVIVRVPNNNEFETVLYTLDKNDTQAPELIYNGNKEIVIKNGESFEVPSVTAIDNFDSDVKVVHIIKNSDGKVIDSIDTSKEGKYTITYTAEDSSKNKSELVIAVTVLSASDNSGEEIPGNSEKPEKPEMAPDVSDTSQDKDLVNKSDSTKLKNKIDKLVSTGMSNPLRILGVGAIALTLGGILGFKRKK